MRRCLGFLVALWIAGCAAPVPPPAPPATSEQPLRVSATKSGAPFPSTLVVSVLPFEQQAPNRDLTWLRKGLPDMLVAHLLRVPSIVVIQRARLEEVLREQSFQVSGRVDDATGVRVGRLAGATLLITGSITPLQGLVRIDSQLVSVEQGVVLGAVTVEGPPADTATMARALAARVVELMPGGEQAVAPTGPDHLDAAARTAEAGERLWQAGQVQDALTAYERALAAEPQYAPARWGYGGLVQQLSVRELVGTGFLATPNETAARLVDRFFDAAFEFETGPSRTMAQADGTFTLRLPVRLRLAPGAADLLTEEADSIGGDHRVVERGRDSVVEVGFGSAEEVGRQILARMVAGRRLYLKLLDHDQRVLAVYSSLRDWVPATWLSSPDGRRLHLVKDRIVEGEAVFSGLSESHLATIFGCRLAVEPVVREQATVRVDMVELDAARETSRANDRQLDTWARAWQNAVEQQWRPPVSERPWGTGYRPTNERTAIVIFDPAAAASTTARLNRGSGDAAFDEAAVAATEAAVRAQSVAAPLVRMPVRARVQFRLIKDLPSLNVVEPAARARRLP